MKSYLIQRGQIKNIKKENIIGVDSLIYMEYMGRAEFEFGAMPASLKEICCNYSDYDRFALKCNNKEKTLHLICNINKFEETEKSIFDIILGKQRTIEPTYLDVLFGGASSFTSPVNIETDFWWDLDNHWMAVIGKENAKKLKIAIEKVKERKGW